MLEMAGYIVSESVNHDRQTEVVTGAQFPQLFECADFRVELEGDDSDRDAIPARLGDTRNCTTEVGERSSGPNRPSKGFVELHRVSLKEPASPNDPAHTPLDPFGFLGVARELVRHADSPSAPWATGRGWESDWFA